MQSRRSLINERFVCVGQLQPPPGQVAVSVQPTQVIVIHPAPLVNPPSDGLVFSILVTMCCCLPLGIFGIVRYGCEYFFDCVVDMVSVA